MFKATPLSWIIEVRGSSKMGEEGSGELFKFYKRFMLILSRPLLIIKCSRGIFLPPNYKMTVTYNSYQNYETNLIKNSALGTTYLKIWIETIDMLNLLKINKASD